MRRLIPFCLIGGMVLSSAASGFAQTPPPITPPANVAAPEIAAAPQDQGDMAAQIQAIRNATDGVAANDAYTRGLKIDPNSIELRRVYVQRMVDLGLPQVAYYAAQQLVQTDPGDGVAWAVVAYDAARHGNMPDALTDVILAGRKAPDDPFVEKTAAQMLAWYDNAPHPPTIPASLQQSMKDVRASLQDKPAYAAAYKDGSAFYKKMAADVQATQNGQAGPNGAEANVAPPPADTDNASAYPPQAYVPDTYAPYALETPTTYYPNPTYVYDYGYPYPAYVYGPVWWDWGFPCIWLGGGVCWFNGGYGFYHHGFFDHGFGRGFGRGFNNGFGRGFNNGLGGRDGGFARGSNFAARGGSGFDRYYGSAGRGISPSYSRAYSPHYSSAPRANFGRAFSGGRSFGGAARGDGGGLHGDGGGGHGGGGHR